MPRKKEWSVEEILNLFSPDQIKTADKALLPITVSPAIWRSILKHLSSGQAKESGLDEADEMDEAWWQNHVRKLTEKHERQIDHNESFYAVRIQAISDLAKQHGIWDEVAAILANETMTPTEPRSYSQILAGWKARAEKAEANYAFMVERAANQHLDGYRELGAKCAELENEADRLRARLREVAQILIAEVGADGPMDAEDAARKAVERMVLLRELADKSAAEAGLYAHRMGQAQEARRLAREEKARALWKQANQHVYREVTYDRDDNPIPPTCAHCGHAKDLCTGEKP